MKYADYLILRSDHKPASEKDITDCVTRIGVRMLDQNRCSIKQFSFAGDDDPESFWRKMSAYRGRETVLVVWDQADEMLIRELDLKYRMSLKLRFLHVNALLGSMLSYAGYEPKSVGKTVRKLGLSWNRTRARDMGYQAEVLTRVLRKLYRAGEAMLGEDFGRYARSGMLYHISKYEYFQVSRNSMEYINRKKYLADRKQELITLLRDKWDAVYDDGDLISIRTDRAAWCFEAGIPVEKLYYQAKRYYRGTRSITVNNSATDVLTNSQVVTNAIRRTEKNLIVNIGNETISKCLDAVGRKCLRGAEMVDK